MSRLGDLFLKVFGSDRGADLEVSSREPHEPLDLGVKGIEREMTRAEWHERLSQRPVTDLGGSAASLLEQERQQSEKISRDPTAEAVAEGATPIVIKS